MFNSATTKPAALSRDEHRPGRAEPLLTRKIWLPKLVYAALPYFYMTTGFLALAAAIYIDHWLWVLPHYLLFAAACVHMGALLFRRRRAAARHED